VDSSFGVPFVAGMVVDYPVWLESRPGSVDNWIIPARKTRVYETQPGIFAGWGGVDGANAHFGRL
jgi:hypothetical protein